MVRAICYSSMNNWRRYAYGSPACSSVILMTMGAKAAIPAEVYLRTSFPDVDPEYREGELVERTMPDYFHGRTQLLLGIFI